jgi:hypothetical protein
MHLRVPDCPEHEGWRRSNRVVLALVHIFCRTSTGAGAFLWIEFGIIIDVPRCRFEF